MNNILSSNTLNTKSCILILVICTFNFIYFYCDMKKTKKIIRENNRIDNKIEPILQELKVMDGREFEFFCSKLFWNYGYKVSVTKATNDEGKDLILNKKIYVECKCWNEDKGTIGREILQKLVGSMVSDKITKGICITTSYFHKNAFEYRNKLNKNTNIELKLYDINDIKTMLKNLERTKI